MKSYRTYLFDFVQESYYSPSVHSICRLSVGKTTVPSTLKVWPPTSPYSHTQCTMYIDIEQENITRPAWIYRDTCEILVSQFKVNVNRTNYQISMA